MQDTIGVDVSKVVLDAYCSLRCDHRQFPNDASGLAKLVRWASGGTTVIVFEASGAYHRDLERMLLRRGWTLAKAIVYFRNTWRTFIYKSNSYGISPCPFDPKPTCMPRVRMH